MAKLIPTLLGGTVAVFLLSKIIGFALGRFVKDPARFAVSIGLAFAIATVIYGYNNGGGSSYLHGLMIYGIGAAICAVFETSSYKNACSRIEVISDPSSTPLVDSLVSPLGVLGARGVLAIQSSA